MTDVNKTGRMSGGADDADDADFIARVAGPLREREQLDPTFEARVMSAVRAEASEPVSALHTARNWWIRPRTVRVSPLAGLAAAAAFAGVIFLSAAGLKSITGSSATSSETHATVAATTTGSALQTALDTVHLVRFVYVDNAAQDVSLVGDFNAWAKGTVHLARTGKPGVWEVSVELPAGRHEYAFIVNDGRAERWDADPFVQEQRDEFGTETSVVTLGDRRLPRPTST